MIRNNTPGAGVKCKHVSNLTLEQSYEHRTTPKIHKNVGNIVKINLSNKLDKNKGKMLENSIQ